MRIGVFVFYDLSLCRNESEVAGERYGYLRPEQHRRAVPELPAGPVVYLQDRRRERRLRDRDEPLCVHGPAARPAHLRDGDDPFPLFEQGRGRSGPGVRDHAPHGRNGVRRLHRGGPRAAAAHRRGDGLRRPPRVRRLHGRDGGLRRFPGHHVFAAAPAAPAGQVHGAEVLLHHPERPAEPAHLPRAAEDPGPA